MILKNISAVSRYSVELNRYFDGDISNDTTDDIYDEDADSVWGHDVAASLSFCLHIRTTKRYSHAMEKAKREAVEKLAESGVARQNPVKK